MVAKQKPKIVLTINVADPSIKDIAKLISGGIIAIITVITTFHFHSTSKQNDIESSQKQVVAAVQDTTKMPKGMLREDVEKILATVNDLAKHDSIRLRNDSIIMDYIHNLSRVDNQIASEGIKMHERDSERLDLAFHTMASLIPRRK